MTAMDMNHRTFLFSEDQTVRLDRFLSMKMEEFSRSYLQKLIEEGCVQVNCTQVSKSGYKVRNGDSVSVTMPELKKLELEAVDIGLDVVFEDDYLLIINKPAGLIVHPANSHNEVTLVHGLMAHCRQLSGIGGVQRPGIVHRLDKFTAGLMVVAKTDQAHRGLSEMLKHHHIRRIYQTLLIGELNQSCGTLDTFYGRHPKKRALMAVLPEGQRRAVTHYQVLESGKGLTYAQVELKTGRTHQIRVHMNMLNCPVAGDRMYGYPLSTGKGRPVIPISIRKMLPELPAHLLVSKKIYFDHPVLHTPIAYEITLPDYFQELLSLLQWEENACLDSGGIIS